MIGQTFGSWTVLADVPSVRQGNAVRKAYLCQCVCEKKAIVIKSALVNGDSKQCKACTAKIGGNAAALVLTKHGHNRYGKGGQTPTYRSWYAMLQRCSNPNNKRYEDYAGRGISVCERWRNFQNFLFDMGERVEGTTLDRINVNGNYERGNCRWADSGTQAKNKRKYTVLDKFTDEEIYQEFYKRNLQRRTIPGAVLETAPESRLNALEGSSNG